MQIKYIIIIKWWRIRRGEEWKMKNWRIRKHKKKEIKGRKQKKPQWQNYESLFIPILHMSKWICVIRLLSHRINEQFVSGPCTAVTIVIFIWAGILFFLTFSHSLSSLSPRKKKLDNTQQYHIHILNNKCKAYDLLVPA